MPENDNYGTDRASITIMAMVAQVLVTDLVFSLDSVITVIGISNIMIIIVEVILILAGIMVVFASQESHFVSNHPTVKMLTLFFLILIGSLLMVDGWNVEAAHNLHWKT